MNGEVAIVVQDAESYQALLNLAQQAVDDIKVHQAIERMQNGEPGIPWENARNELFANLKSYETSSLPSGDRPKS